VWIAVVVMKNMRPVIVADIQGMHDGGCFPFL